MWTHGIIVCMYIVSTYNIIVVLVAHYNSFKVVVTCNYNVTLEKVKHGWLHMYVWCL
jgi:hypothetical protein